VREVRVSRGVVLVEDLHCHRVLGAVGSVGLVRDFHFVGGVSGRAGAVVFEFMRVYLRKGVGGNWAVVFVRVLDVLGSLFVFQDGWVRSCLLLVF
jgi:hypothetical protein